jgi:apurinic endonuclease APN1
MKIGAHVSTAKPFSQAINRASEIGCECMQIFANPPQRWNPVPIAEEEVIKFIKLNREANIAPVLVHGIYLLNLASSNPFFYEASIKSLVDDMKKAAQIGATGVNFHVGSTKGDDIKNLMPKVEDAVRKILDQSPEGPCLIIENSAGAGNIIGDTLDEIAEILEAVKSSRLKVLIDTAHAFESGYDIRGEKGIANFIDQFEKAIGLDRLVGFHLNDSKTPLNSKRDRHADIGTGQIGLEPFRWLLNNPKLKDKCGILETPQEEADWKEQIKLLKSLE